MHFRTIQFCNLKILVRACNKKDSVAYAISDSLVR